MARFNRVILVAALIGFVAGILTALYANLVGDFSGGVLDFLIVICPAGLLLVALNHVMQSDRSAFYAVWLLICCLNAAIYALVTAFIVGLLGRKDAS
jgi:ABC-type antimicrobial peptide transport system permease subunit